MKKLKISAIMKAQITIRQVQWSNLRRQKMNNGILPNNYKETLDLIIQKIELAQQKAVISANISLLDLYWDIGNIILNRKKEQGWGQK